MTFNPELDISNKKRGIGRLAPVRKITTYEAKQEALHMLRSGQVKAKTKLRSVLMLLGTTGVLLEEQLLDLTGVSERTLRRYRQKSLLDVVPTPIKLTNLLSEERRIWTLGPIGTALTEMLHGQGLIPTGYLSSRLDRATHDVLCSLVYYHLYCAAKQKGYTAILKSKYEATLHNRKGQPVLEPDAMVILRQPEMDDLLFTIEYHNEDFASRAAEKVRKYENIYQDGLYTQWQTKKMPPILIVTTHRAVAVGYKEIIDTRLTGAGVRCTYLIKPLRTFLDKTQSPLVWLNLATNKTISLLKL